MKTINLRDFYPWYTADELVEVTDEVAAALQGDRQADAAYTERVRRNKAYYSLDCDDGIEYSICQHEPTPDELLDRKENFCRLWDALNALPETQGRRIDACIFAIDGYEISATFADSRNPAAIGQVKQILLSSFASSAPKNKGGDILAITHEQRDNNDRGKPCAP